jgi:hypothetical protein
MDLIKRAQDLGFIVEIHSRSTVFLKYPTVKNCFAIFHLKSLYEFEAFLEGFAVAAKYYKPKIETPAPKVAATAIESKS